MKKNIRLSDKKTLIASAIFFTALLLILFCCFFLEKPNPFPYQFKVNGTTFHLATVRNLDRKILMQRKGKVAKEIRHVYIASNGPKVWIAECVNEITKETKCHYENFSSY